MAQKPERPGSFSRQCTVSTIVSSTAQNNPLKPQNLRLDCFPLGASKDDITFLLDRIDHTWER